MTIQDLARGFPSSVQSSVTAVTTAVGELQSGATPSNDEIDAAISGASTINTSLQNFIAQDVNNAFAASTSDATAKLQVVQKLLYDEQSSIAAHASTGFVPPPDATELSNAVAAWQAVLSDINGGFANTAAAIDAATSGSSAAASAGAAAQAAAEAAAAGQTSGGGTSTTPTTTPPTTPTTPTSTTPTTTGPLPPAVVATATPSTSSSASILPSVSPAAAVFVGVGLIVVVVVGLATGYLTVPKAVGETLGLTKNPTHRRRRRRARR